MAIQKPEWFKIDPAKFLSDAQVDAMSTLELGACFRLLCRQWLDGFIPDDLHILARLCRLDASGMREAWVTLCPFFPVIEDGKRANRFMFIEREKVVAELERKSDEGSRAARKRWDDVRKNRDATPIAEPNGSPMPDPMQEQSRAEQTRPEDTEANASVCPGPSQVPDPPPSPVLFEVSCRGTGKKTWPITQAKLEEWTEAFPGVDVRVQLRQAIQWLRDHPDRGKTYSGMPGYFSRWLAKEQNRTPSTTAGGTHGTRTASHHRTRVDEDYLKQNAHLFAGDGDGSVPKVQPGSPGGEHGPTKW